MTVNEMTQEDLIQWAWLAGLIDGDGCFSVTTTGKTPTGNPRKSFTSKIRVVLTEKDKFVLDKIQSFAGGTISIRRLSQYDNYHLKNTNDQYEWRISGQENCKNMAETLLPFLVLKKQTCSKFLEVIGC